MPRCMSDAIACKDFLQTSGKWPPSLVMPPSWPPMPSAQVLHAFLLRSARHIGSHPTRLATRAVYTRLCQPPPDRAGFMRAYCSGRRRRACAAPQVRSPVVPILKEARMRRWLALLMLAGFSVACSPSVDVEKERAALTARDR